MTSHSWVLPPKVSFQNIHTCTRCGLELYTLPDEDVVTGDVLSKRVVDSMRRLYEDCDFYIVNQIQKE